MANIEFNFTLDQQVVAFYNLFFINLDKELRLALAKYILSKEEYTETNDNTKD